MLKGLFINSAYFSVSIGGQGRGSYLRGEWAKRIKPKETKKIQEKLETVAAFSAAFRPASGGSAGRLLRTP